MFEDIRYMQYFAAIVASTAVAANACFLTWTSPTLPLLQSDNSPIGITVTDSEASWIVSLFSLAVVPAAATGGWYVEILGRKRSIIISVILMFIPWIINYFAKAVWLIIVGRCIAGYTLGLVTIACTMYIGEISENDIRGKLGTMFNLMKIVGSFIVLTFAPFVSYHNLIFICATLPIIFLVLAYFIPESPYFYMRKGNKKACREALKTLSKPNASDAFIEARLLEIETTVNNDMKNKTTTYEFFTNKDYRKVIFIVTGIKILQQMSGAAAIESYMQTIIEDSDSNISPDVSSIIFGAVQIPAALVASALVDRVGRKPLLIISAIGCFFGLLGEGIYFFLQDYVQYEHMSSLAWLPTSGIVIFIVMSPIGVYTLPYVLLGELFPTNIKGVAVSAATVFGGTLGFVVALLFTPISDVWGTYTIFWIYAGVCIAGVIFVYYYLPETKGKTFDEIQHKINGPKIEMKTITIEERESVVKL